jgi:A/G-specific adenine glycosylase
MQTVSMNPVLFRRRLLAWFRRHKRDLPWRRQVSPYRTWISEIMLQQTTVATVAKRFEAWIRRWPDVAALARATETELLRAWEGLGYYTRARNLGKAARLIVEHHAGRLPSDPTALRALPGIGEYTSAAILSIAFGRPIPLIDANVRRVMMRLLGMTRASATVERRILATLQALVSRRRPGAFNEAMMEIGALVCLPEAPRCFSCPLAGFCQARATGRLTLDSRRPTITPRRSAIAIVLADGKVLLRRREPGEINAGMWSFPIVATGDASVQPSAFKRFGRRGAPLEPLTPRIHAYTRFRERLEPVIVRVKRVAPTEPGERWIGRADLDRHPMPSVYRRILKAALGS